MTIYNDLVVKFWRGQINISAAGIFDGTEPRVGPFWNQEGWEFTLSLKIVHFKERPEQNGCAPWTCLERSCLSELSGTEPECPGSAQRKIPGRP